LTISFSSLIYFVEKKKILIFILYISFIKDEEKWSPAYPIQGFMSIPVQYKIETKKTDGTLNTIINSVTQFRPTLFLEQENYYVIKIYF
jgi:hypothetical protein